MTSTRNCERAIWIKRERWQEKVIQTTVLLASSPPRFITHTKKDFQLVQELGNVLNYSKTKKKKDKKKKNKQTKQNMKT